MFAVISHNNNQYKIKENDLVKIDFFEAKPKDKITFSDVLLVSDEKETKVGTPNISGASVLAEVVENIRSDKVLVFKFHSKKRYKRTKGHRQDYVMVKILKINL